MAALSKDLELLRSWWERLAPSVSHDTRGLWFGIVDLVVDGGSVRHLYVAGCPTFDRDDQGDWACEYSWWPDDRYIALPSLASSPDHRDGDIVENAAALVRALHPATASDRIDGVGVGFDGGDVEIVWARSKT